MAGKTASEFGKTYQEVYRFCGEAKRQQAVYNPLLQRINILDSSGEKAIAPPGQEGWMRHTRNGAKHLFAAAGVVVPVRKLL